MLRNLLGIGLLTAALLAPLGCGPTTSQSALVFGSWTPTEKPSPAIHALEQAMHRRLNRDRSLHSLPPLAYDEDLADVARAHSADMRDHDFFAHDSPTTGLLEDRMIRAGYLATEMRENLALAGDVDKAQDNLLESPGHRDNILSATISRVGIGIVPGDSRGDPRALTITQVFAQPVTLDSPAEAKDKLVRAIGIERKKRGLPPLALHPLLNELAARYLPELPDVVPESAVDDIGDEVQNHLNDSNDHGLSAIGLVAQTFFNADEFPVPAASSDGAVRHYGIAATDAKDDRGRPRVKVLMLLGRAAGR
jgi:uncharacterized protein YkwD